MSRGDLFQKQWSWLHHLFEIQECPVSFHLMQSHFRLISGSNLCCFCFTMLRLFTNFLMSCGWLTWLFLKIQTCMAFNLMKSDISMQSDCRHFLSVTGWRINQILCLWHLYCSVGCESSGISQHPVALCLSKALVCCPPLFLLVKMQSCDQKISILHVIGIYSSFRCLFLLWGGSQEQPPLGDLKYLMFKSNLM